MLKPAYFRKSFQPSPWRRRKWPRRRFKAAITFVNSAVLADTGSVTTASTGAFAATAGNLIVVGIRQAIPATCALPMSVQDTAGNLYRRITAADSTASSTDLMTVWYAYNIIANASNVITVKFGNAVSNVAIIARQYSGLSTTSDPFDNPAIKNGSVAGTSATSASFNTAQTNEVIVAFVSTTSAAETFSVGLIGGVNGGNQVSDNTAGSQAMSSEDRIVSSAQAGITAAMSWNVSATYEMSVVTFSDVPNSNLRFDYVQSKEAENLTSASTISVVLNAAPTPGDLICIVVNGFNGGTLPALSKVQDGNGNFYNVTPNSPSNVKQSTAGAVWLAWLVAPANASATITATWASAISDQEIYAYEFLPVGGTVSFDKDVAGNGAAVTLANTPSITPTNGAGELLFSAVNYSNNGTSCGTPWTMGGGGIPSFGSVTAFVTSSSAGSTSVNAPCTSSDYDSMAMAFILTAFPPSNQQAAEWTNNPFTIKNPLGRRTKVLFS